MAQEIASAFAGIYDVSLIYCFEKPGVLKDVNDDASLIKKINASDYGELKADCIITYGMLPKLDNAFAALNKAVQNIVIGNGDDLQQLIQLQAGNVIGV